MNQIVAHQLAISRLDANSDHHGLIPVGAAGGSTNTTRGSKSNAARLSPGSERGMTPTRQPMLCYISNIMASRSVNKVILVGHLGQDAETRFTPGGAAVTRFSVATNRRWKEKQSGEWKEETDWSNVVLWRSENLANYLTKGKQVYVAGRLQTRSYEDKDGKKVYATDVVADDVILLSNQGGGGGGGGGRGGGEHFFAQPG